MLHSKVCLMEMENSRSSAFIGSHNLTGFALMGLNGEAGVLLEGPSSSAEFDDIRNHIATAVRQAVVVLFQQRYAMRHKLRTFWSKGSRPTAAVRPPKRV